MGNVELLEKALKLPPEERFIIVEGLLKSLDVPDPDALAAEFLSRKVNFSEPLKDTDDGLRGFELKDADGYVLFFGRPRT